MLYEKLKHLSEKPALYGIEDIEDIRIFIFGIDASVEMYKTNIDEEYLDFSNFQNWVKDRYNGGDTSSWVSLIRFNSTSNNDSIKLFNILLKQYLEYKQK